MATDLDLIRLRRGEISREIAELSSRIDELRSEIPDLDTAERVLARLTGFARGQASEAVTEPEATTGSAKPEGTPSVTEMIKAALIDARERRGLRGLEPQDMVPFVATTWWPDVKANNLGPIAWRMWKRGELNKDESLYMLLETNKGSDVGASEPSEVPAPQSKTIEELLG